MKTRLAILSICLAAFCLKSTELWRFLPNFQVDVRGIQHAIQHGPDIVETLPVPAETLLSANAPLTESQRNERHWHPARFPHRDFVSMMPQRNVFGWYGCLFDIPQALQDMDVLADLGIVDDTDETYVNGVRIGGTGEIGKPHGTAWQTDRLYRIPAEGLTPYVNYMAVHVWNLWGLGGIIGPPVLKTAVAPPDAQWELAFAKDSSASPSGLNHALEASTALAAVAGDGSLE